MGWIYGLRAIEDQTRIRYAGQTIGGLQGRLRTHLNGALRKNSPEWPVFHWLRKIDGKAEIISLIEVSSGDEGVDRWLLDIAEIHTICQLRSLGQSDLNVTDGGGGTKGWRPSEEQIQHMREAKKRDADTHRTPQARANISKSQLVAQNRPDVVHKKREAALKVQKEVQNRPEVSAKRKETWRRKKENGWVYPRRKGQ